MQRDNPAQGSQLIVRQETTEQAGALKWSIVVAMALLAALCIAWETALAPIREGAWLLSLKAIPLLMALPGMIRGRIRTFQWWSMLTMIYLSEGLVRATTETGLSQTLAWVEAGLSAIIFFMVLAWCKIVRKPAYAA
ncbi:MAG: DUF2069 domain-containing protein [Burkholderiaceae bacterium]